MTQSQKAFLEANKHYWDEYKLTKVVKHYDNALRKELAVIAKTFDPKAIFCTWCNDDAAKMLEYVYTQYEKTIGNTKEEGVKVFTFPHDIDLIQPDPELIRQHELNNKTKTNEKRKSNRKRGLQH